MPVKRKRATFRHRRGGARQWRQVLLRPLGQGEGAARAMRRFQVKLDAILALHGFPDNSQVATRQVLRREGRHTSQMKDADHG